ncbi:hypothetical protein P4607_28725, partial [Priestia megaterium]|uniref:hypothetical protein n=1 Tax=Priestia megaterium TaxID=1404 RepID=UPI002E1C1503|nr:hypothetical protein [Priestia megaterium]
IFKMKELNSNPQLLFFVCVFHFDSFLILVRQGFIDTYFIGARKINKESFIGCFVPKICFMVTRFVYSVHRNLRVSFFS